MKSMSKFVGFGAGLVLAVSISACGGAAADGKGAQSPTTTSGSVDVKVQLDLPNTGNAKYDKFFDDTVSLAQLVADARASLETAPATLNKAMGVAEGTDFDAAFKSAREKLKGKVTITVNVTPAGADVKVVPVGGALSAEDQALVDAYKKVVTDIAAIPSKLEPVVAKSIDLAKQAAGLIASAKSDFVGFSGLKTLPSVIKGIGKVTSAIDSIKTDVPVIVDKAKAMTVTIKGAV